jgi:hypothetical protein
MPIKSRRDRRREQAQNRRISEKNATTQNKAASSLYKQGNKSAASNIKDIEKGRREAKKTRDKELRSTLHKVAKVGLYVPKEFKLTKYRRSRLSKLEKSGKLELLNSEKFFFVPIPKAKRRKTLANSEQLKIDTSKTGVFIPRDKHTRARLVTDSKGELIIIRSGKTRRGTTKGRTYKTITPLVSLDELGNERERLREQARKLGPITTEDYTNGVRLVFHVSENGIDGWSQQTFEDIDLLLNYLEARYDKTTAARVNFYRHITIEKSTVNDWFTRHAATDAGNPGKQARAASNKAEKERRRQEKVRERKNKFNTRLTKG